MWIKKLRQRKFQSAMIFLIALICAMLLTSAMSIIFSLDQPFWELAKASDAPTLRVYLKDEGDEAANQLLSKIKSIDAIDRVQPIKQYSLADTLFYNGEKIEGFFTFNQYNEAIHQKIRFISDQVGPPADGECFLPAVVSDKYGIKVGDTITFQNQNKVYELVVKAIVTDPYMATLATSCQIVVGKMPEGVPLGNVILVYGKEGVKGVDLVTAIRNANDGQLNGYTMTIEAAANFNLITGKILGGILFCGGIIILLVSCIIIRFMIRNAMIWDMNTIAVYKTIGYSSKEIQGMYMKLYLFLVSMGCVVGILGSIVISNLFLEQAFKSIGVSKGGNILLPGVISYSVITGIVSFNIYRILRETKKVSPVAIFSGIQKALGKHKMKRRPEGHAMSFSPLAIALRTIGREKKNTAFIILTAIVSLYGVNFAVASMDNIKTMTAHNYYWLGFDKSDVVISGADQETFEKIYEDLTQDTRVGKVIKRSSGQGFELKWQKGLGDPNIEGFCFDTFEGIEVPLVEGRNPKYKDEVVVSTLIADELGKTIGDYVDLIIDGKVQSFLLTGTFQSFYGMGRGIRLLGESLVAEGESYPYSECSIYLKEGVDRESFNQSYDDAYGSGISVTNREELYKNILDMITGPQEKALLPFMSFVVVMGIINIFSVVVLRNLNNQKTNSIYKSMGYSSWHLLKVNTWYIGIVAVIAMVITLPLFVVAYPKVMVLALSMFGFKSYPIFYSMSKLIVMNLMVLGLFILSSVLSSRSLFKISIKELNQE